MVFKKKKEYIMYRIVFLTKNDKGVTMDENELSKMVIGLAIKVHKTLGPGLLESAYEKALVHELRKNGFKADNQKTIFIEYDGFIIDEGFRADVIVNDLLILELKSVRNLEDIHFKQLLTYLRLSNLKLGLLINFNENILKNGIKRVVNKLWCFKKSVSQRAIRTQRYSGRKNLISHMNTKEIIKIEIFANFAILAREKRMESKEL